jgi:hypothetical protein
VSVISNFCSQEVVEIKKIQGRFLVIIVRLGQNLIQYLSQDLRLELPDKLHVLAAQAADTVYLVRH